MTTAPLRALDPSKWWRAGQDSDPERESDPAGADDGPATLWLSELLVGGLVVLVALVAWVSLALAHLGHHSLPAVVAGSAVAALAVTGIAVFPEARRRRAPSSSPAPSRVRIRADPMALIGTAVLGLFALWMFLPGFHYGVGDKDPGGYVQHAMAIARTGDYSIADPMLDTNRVPAVQLASPGAALPGVWIAGNDPHRIVPQFYHLWPALMATTYDVAGESGLAATGPLCGALAVLAAALALRRAVASAPWGSSPTIAERTGLLAGAAAGLLLTTNMLEVWQAKYPTTEISTQLFFVGTLLALAITLSTGWRPAAGVAGLLTGISFLDRADALLTIGIFAAAGAVLVAIRRFDARAWWFTGGLAIVLPHALWQAYSNSAALAYTKSNNLPSLAKVTVAVAGLFVVAAVVRVIAGKPIAALLDVLKRRGAPGRPSPQQVIGFAICLVAAGLLVLGFLRPRLFGADIQHFSSGEQRSYDELTLRRLSWFLTVPAFALAGLGLAVLALRRWSAALWVLAIPTLLLFPVYADHARNSVRLMWWTRRFVPTVLPGLMLLIGLLLAAVCMAGAQRRWGGVPLRRVLWIPAALAFAGLLAFFLPQSLPLRSHDEMGGSFAISQRIADLSGKSTGVYLWPSQPSCCGTPTNLFAGPVWLGRGELSALLPADKTRQPGYVRSFIHGFPGQPVFVVAFGQQAPVLPGVRVAVADRIDTSIPMWEETVLSRPDHSIRLPVNMSIYRVS